MYGPADGPTVVLTHGWGANATEWYYLKKHLGDRFRLIAWDLPGLGLSKRPDNNDYSLDKMARRPRRGGRPGRECARGAARAQHRRDDQPDLLPALPRVARPQGVGAGPGAHHPDQSGADDEECGAVHGLAEAGDRAPAPPDDLALAPGLGDELDVLPQRLGAPIDGEGVVLRERDPRPARFRARASCRTPRPPSWPRDVRHARLRRVRDPQDDRRPGPGRPGRPDATTTPEASDWMDRDIPKSRLEALSPAKHMGLLEHNDRFSKLVGEFVSSCSPSRRPGVAGRAA